MEVHQPAPYRVVIMASGNGTNAERLMGYFRDSDLAEVVLVLTNKKAAGVVQRAANAGVTCEWMSREVYSSGDRLTARLQAERADLVVLAGYLKLLPAETVQAYAGCIVNVHPSLLPKHGGKGMYGMKVHEAVIAEGDSHSGITIHQVNEVYDEGEVIFQATIPVEADWTPEDLAQAIHQLEYAHFPDTIEKLLQQRRAEGIPPGHILHGTR